MRIFLILAGALAIATAVAAGPAPAAASTAGGSADMLLVRAGGAGEAFTVGSMEASMGASIPPMAFITAMATVGALPCSLRSIPTNVLIRMPIHRMSTRIAHTGRYRLRNSSPGV